MRHATITADLSDEALVASVRAPDMPLETLDKHLLSGIYIAATRRGILMIWDPTRTELQTILALYASSTLLHG